MPIDLGYPEGIITRDFSNFPYRLLPLSIIDRTNSVRETYLRFETPEYSAWVPANFQQYITTKLLYNEKDTIGMKEARRMCWTGLFPSKDQTDLMRQKALVRLKYPYECDVMDSICYRMKDKECGVEQQKITPKRGMSEEDFYRALVGEDIEDWEKFWDEAKEKYKPEEMDIPPVTQKKTVTQKHIITQRQIKIISIIALVILTGGLFCFSSLFKTMFNEISKPKK